ncbi:RAMP superfamily CRISPR-associated protein [Rhodococcus cerastii]|uniref:RAMP superfamily CRISPR-associated protein n=1 Tax=Rhodococcus cerastii TaxID=908616 RepID=A0ABU4D6P0_9NOCA|nr:RAMP superfamily CRISPR-associated protein [Rhodococcus cerastii]MDV6305350.1 RAMP superfamily CRISPR-associated protein [Rhodococcus cerastii]
MTAPYTFVGFRTPMPGHHFAQDNSAVHDRPVVGRVSGRIDLTITTLSPLFIGSVDHAAGTTTTLNSVPVIPGSALKGMARSYLAAMTGSTLGPQADRIIWYRNPVGDNDSPTLTALHHQYVAVRGQSAEPGRQRIGLLTRTTEGTYRVTECVQLRLQPPNQAFYYSMVPKVTWRILARDLSLTRDIDDDMLRSHNDRRVFVVWAAVDTTPARGQRSIRRVVFAVGTTAQNAMDAAARRRLKNNGVRDSVPKNVVAAEFLSFLDDAGNRHDGQDDEPSPQVMVLHATGLTSSRDGDRNTVSNDERNAYLFPLRKSQTTTWIANSGDHAMRNVGEWDITPEFVDAALRDDRQQLTDYQRSLPDIDELLTADGVPVFFDTAMRRNREILVRLGRGGGFRVRAKKPFLATIDKQFRDAGFDAQAPDLVQSLFGDSDEVAARKGRVSFGTAVAQSNAPRLSTQSDIVLLGPKIEAWYRRLKQSSNPTTHAPITYNSDDATYRGREMYMHRWPKDVTDIDETWTAIAKQRRNPGNADNAVGRAITPVAPDTTFTASIRFTNLTAAELGALLQALLLGNTLQDNTAGNPVYAHLVGGGRPLGLGSIHLSPTVYLDHPDRYTRWDAPMWHTATNAEVGEYMQAFRVALEQAEPDSRQWTTGPDGRSWPRSIAEVFTVAQWRNRLPEDLTAEMPLADHRLKKIPKPLSELTPMFGR